MEEEEGAEVPQRSDGEVLDVIDDVAVPGDDEGGFGLALEAAEDLEGGEDPHAGEIGGHDDVDDVVGSCGEEFVKLVGVDDHHACGEVPGVNVGENFVAARVGVD